MLKINSKKLAEIVESDSKPLDCEISNICTDSRKVKEGDLFIAIKGENFDAHDFVAQVIQNGAALVIVEHLVQNVPAERQLVVKSSLHAYGLIGAYVRSQFQGVVIGLTGSAGKTTTKEELKFALSLFGKTYATSGNHNNQVGVPITLCELDMSAKYAVIEMGMSAKGEIEELTSFVQPDIALITNVYPMHIEFFENFEGIAEAKAEIFKSLKKGGIAVINEDTNFAPLLEQRAKENGAKICKFGRKHHPEVKLELSDEGEAFWYNAWCVLTVIEALGLDVHKAAESLKNFGALDGRGKVHTLKFSKGTYQLIDDSYSGQPEAMLLAIKALDERKVKGRKIAVIGKMAELGATSEARHIEVGKALDKSSVDVIIGVCPETKVLLAQISPNKQKYYFENKDGLDEFLLNKVLQNNDIVLIKGARYSSKLYQVTENLLTKGA